MIEVRTRSKRRTRAGRPIVLVAQHPAGAMGPANFTLLRRLKGTPFVSAVQAPLDRLTAPQHPSLASGRLVTSRTHPVRNIVSTGSSPG